MKKSAVISNEEMKEILSEHMRLFISGKESKSKAYTINYFAKNLLKSMTEERINYQLKKDGFQSTFFPENKE